MAIKKKQNLEDVDLSDDSTNDTTNDTDVVEEGSEKKKTEEKRKEDVLKKIKTKKTFSLDDYKKTTNIPEGIIGLPYTAEFDMAYHNETSNLNLINTLYACPNGVMRMSDSISGLVETSLNLALLKIKYL